MIACVWLVGLGALAIALQAAYWVIALFALPVLPLLWDIWHNPQSTLRLDTRALSWRCPRSHADIALDEILQITITTRWDFSRKITVGTKIGTKHIMPPDVTPPHLAFEAAAVAHGLSVKRQHFTVF